MIAHLLQGDMDHLQQYGVISLDGFRSMRAKQLLDQKAHPLVVGCRHCDNIARRLYTFGSIDAELLPDAMVAEEG